MDYLNDPMEIEDWSKPRPGASKFTKGLSPVERSLVPLVAKGGCFDLRILRQAVHYANAVSTIDTFEENVKQYYNDASSFKSITTKPSSYPPRRLQL